MNKKDRETMDEINNEHKPAWEILASTGSTNTYTDRTKLIPAKDWEDNVKGWICPKCGKVNAPWKGSCDCTQSYYPVPYYPYWKYDPYNPPWTITCIYG